MTITPTASGLDHLIVATFLEGVKAKHIMCQYSGTMRWRDANLPRDFMLTCIDGWLGLVNDPIYALDYQIDPLGADTDAAEILSWLLNDGSVTLDDRNSAFVNLSSGIKRLGFDFTSQSNIPEGGLVLYGVDGIGAIMPESDSIPQVIEGTLETYYAQFPNRRVQGNDVALLLAATGSLLNRMFFDSPNDHVLYMGYIAAFRAMLESQIPPVTP